jgi:uncharacterized protein (TIGR02246 family)
MATSFVAIVSSAAARACAVLALAVALAGCGGRTFSSSDRAAIEGLLAAQQAAWNQGDLDAFMAGYMKDTSLSFASGGEVQRGWERTMARYLERYPDPATMGVLHFEIEEVRPISPDAALVLGAFMLTETPKAGTGVFTLLVQRRPEGWRIVHDHTSAAPPSAPAASAPSSPSRQPRPDRPL